MLIIRNVEPTDIFAVIKLSHETLTEHYSPSLFNYFYETFPQGFLVAEKNNKLIGFIIGIKTVDDSVRILMLGVSQNNRKKKVGTNLIRRFFEIMYENNVRKIYLEVRTNNEIAIKFYKKMGFNIIDVIPMFYQSGEDAYSMSRLL
ncbi:MAG: ribosomal protein S18-alanine N-acetyltransferase [Candidatus Thermoplasmatota archaeon]|nr:ribosomal protein S18-alanine N-acetyltransferase [Candidatus Thermoplasmatota archaeon]